MWLATQRGFFSIVRKDDGKFHVRARALRDLHMLLELAGMGRRHSLKPLGPGDVEPIWTKGSDYPCRVLVNRRQLARIFRALAGDIDYPNFKARIASREDQRGKLGAYHGLWAALQVQKDGYW
jgi:hypothetical protein